MDPELLEVFRRFGRHGWLAEFCQCSNAVWFGRWNSTHETYYCVMYVFGETHGTPRFYTSVTKA